MLSSLACKNSMFQVSQGLPQPPPFAFLPRKVSRISLKSVFASSQSAEEMARSLSTKAKEDTEQAGKKMQEVKDNISESASASFEDTKAKTDKAAKQASKGFQDFKSGVEEKASELSESAKSSFEDNKAKTDKAAGEAQENLKGLADATAEKAKEGADGVGKAVQDALDAAKGAVKGATSPDN